MFLLGYLLLPGLSKLIILMQLQIPFRGILVIVGRDLRDDLRLEGAFLHLLLLPLQQVLLYLQHLLVITTPIHYTRLIQLP